MSNHQKQLQFVIWKAFGSPLGTLCTPRPVYIVVPLGRSFVIQFAYSFTLTQRPSATFFPFLSFFQQLSFHLWIVASSLLKKMHRGFLSKPPPLNSSTVTTTTVWGYQTTCDFEAFVWSFFPAYKFQMRAWHKYLRVRLSHLVYIYMYI